MLHLLATILGFDRLSFGLTSGFMLRVKFSEGSPKTAQTILKRKRDDKAKRMYHQMKDAMLDNLDSCHLWAMFANENRF